MMPLTKSKIPATEPKDLPTLSLPMTRHVAKIGESPILVNAIATVAVYAKYNMERVLRNELVK